MSSKQYDWEAKQIGVNGVTIGGSNGDGRWNYFTTTHAWTSLAADTTSTVAMSTSTSEGGGVLLLDASGTDNNEVAVYSTNKSFLFASGATLDFRSCHVGAELASNAANYAMGFVDASGGATLADLLGDNGGGPHASIASGVMLYKIDGGTKWILYAKNNSLTASEESVVVPGGSDYKDYCIHVNCTKPTGGDLIVTASIDNAPLLNSRGLPIQLRLAYASAVTMKAFLYGKTGGAVALQIKNKFLMAGQGNRANA